MGEEGRQRLNGLFSLLGHVMCKCLWWCTVDRAALILPALLTAALYAPVRTVDVSSRGGTQCYTQEVG